VLASCANKCKLKGISVFARVEEFCWKTKFFMKTSCKKFATNTQKPRQSTSEVNHQRVHPRHRKYQKCVENWLVILLISSYCLNCLDHRRLLQITSTLIASVALTCHPLHCL
jgi:hypothetical protein